jgi:hypothetical protein
MKVGWRKKKNTNRIFALIFLVINGIINNNLSCGLTTNFA